MGRPALLTRMIHSRRVASLRVSPELKVALAVIAAHAGKTQILQHCCATGRQRNDMINLHNHDKLLLCLTILALPPGAFVELLPYAVRYARHPLYRRVEVLFDIMSPLLQQDERSRSQHHLLIHHRNQLRQLVFILAEKPTLIAKIKQIALAYVLFGS